MYSKIKLFGHPVHPMLVAFPVTFYTVAFFGFLAFAINGNPFWFKTALGANYAGIVTAIAAALPGFLDWYMGIPRDSAARERGSVHAIYNVSALVLFALNAALLWGTTDALLAPIRTSVFLTGLGFLLTAAAGYHGYALVGTYKVGVDLSPEQEQLEKKNELREKGQRAA